MRRAPPLGIWLGAVLVSCASPAPQGRFFIDRAHQYAEAGDLERALSYTESAMQQQPSDPDPDEISLHIELLRRLDRGVEADAFEEFAGRYAAGAATDSEDTVPTLTECAKLERKRAHTTRLVREFGHPSPVSFEIGTLAATYEIDAEGRPIRIRVLRARHPASAWLIIQSIAEAKIWKSRLARASEPFPIAHCAYWPDDVGPVWIPSRVRAFM